MSSDENPQPGQGVAEAPRRQPIFNLPAAVAAVAGLFLAVTAADSLVLNDSGREALFAWFAFVPYRLVEPAGLPGGIWPLLWTPVTHAFLHAGWEHVLLNTVWFVIFATPVVHRYGAVRMLVLFLVGAIAGAAAFAATTLPHIAVLVGASGGVAGLTGAAVRFIFQPVQVAIHPETDERVLLGRRLATIREVFAHPTARIFTITWVALNGIVPLLPIFMSGMQVEIAWQAHLAGFLAGFLLVPLFERRGA